MDKQKFERHKDEFEKLTGEKAVTYKAMYLQYLMIIELERNNKLLEDILRKLDSNPT